MSEFTTPRLADGHVAVPVDDVMRVLHGPLGDPDAYTAAVNRLYDACMGAAEAAGPAPEDEDITHEGTEVPF